MPLEAWQAINEMLSKAVIPSQQLPILSKEKFAETALIMHLPNQKFHHPFGNEIKATTHSALTGMRIKHKPCMALCLTAIFWLPCHSAQFEQEPGSYVSKYSDITPSLPENYQRELGTVHIESEEQCIVIINAAFSLPSQEHEPNAAFLFLL